MRKVLLRRFKESFKPFNMLTVHKCPDTGLFGHLLTPPFSVYNFRKKSPLRPIFSLRVFQFLCSLRKYKKTSLAFIERECFSSLLNMLTNRLKFSDTNKLELFEPIFFQSNQQLSKKYWRAYLSSLSVPLTC